MKGITAGTEDAVSCANGPGDLGRVDRFLLQFSTSAHLFVLML